MSTFCSMATIHTDFKNYPIAICVCVERRTIVIIAELLAFGEFSQCEVTY